MRNCATPTTRFETPTNLALEVAFDGAKLTSDGGLTWLSLRSIPRAWLVRKER